MPDKITNNLRFPGKRKQHFRFKQPSPELKIDLSLDELFNHGRASQNSDYFLGILTKQNISSIFHKSGIYDLLSEKGINNPQIRLDTSDPYRQKFWMYVDSFSPETTIAEIVLHKCTVEIDNMILADFRKMRYNVLHIEWLLLQNPFTTFSEKRPRLPGQKYPGLGMGNIIMDMLVMTGRTLRVDALSNIPNYLHTAFIFTKEFKFIIPEKQGLIDAMKRDLLSNYPLHKVAWAMAYETIISNRTKKYFKWEPEELIYPLTPKLKDYFHSEQYINRKNEAYKKNSFYIDEEKFAAEEIRKGITED